MILDLCIAAVIGVLFGNFASTVLFRLPRGIPIHGYNKKIGKPPHCSVCGHDLKFYEYLPVLSWLSARGKCNYCGTKINPEYTILEVGTALLAIIVYFVSGGFSDSYILLLLAGAIFLLSVFIFEDKKSDVNKILLVLAIIGIVYRTLNEVSIEGWIVSLIFAYVVYVILTYNTENTEVIESFSLKLILLAGVWLKIRYQLIYFVLIYLINQLHSPIKNRFRILVILLYIFILAIYRSY